LSLKKTALIWVIILFPFLTILSQTALVESYSSYQYKADRTNWDAARDSLHLIYVGNNSELLVFDGSNWKSYTVPGRTVRAVETARNGTVFWGSANDFGYLDRNKNGTLSIISLKEKVTDKLRPPTTIFQILTSGDKVYFETQNGFVVYNYKTDDLSYNFFDVDGSIIIDSELIDDTLYVISDHGLYMLNHNTFQPVSVGPGVIPSNFFSILPYSNSRYLIVDEVQGIYTVTKSFTDKQPLTNVDNELLVSSRFYLTSKAVPLQHSSFFEYLIVTNSGIFHIDHSGAIIEHYSTENGLISNSVFEVLVDRNSFWVSTDAGLNRISRSDLLKVLPIKNASSSTLYSAHYRKPFYYLGSSSGILVKHDSSKHFIPVTSSSDQIWDLIDFKNGVLAAGGNGGLFYLEGDRIIRHIPTETSVMTIKKLSSKPSRVVVGLYNGAGFLNTNRAEWSFESIPVVDGTIQSISEDVYQNVWIGTRYDGIYQIKKEALTDGSLSSEFIRTFSKSDGIFPDEHHTMFVFQDTLITTTSTGFLYFDEQNEVFKEFRQSIGRYSYPDFVQLSDSSFLLDDDIRRMLVISHKNGPISVDENYFNMIPGRIKDIDPLGDDRYLVTTPTHVFEINGKGRNNKSASDLWVTFNTTDQQQDNYTIQFSHRFMPPLTFFPGKKISASFSLPNQEIQRAVEYRYRLSPVDTVWSQWSNQTNISWQSLSSGEYDLEIDVLKPDGSRQLFAAIPFSIVYKWYNGPIAYIFYFFSAGFVIWGFIYGRQYRLLKHNNYLEGLVKERTLEITEQNHSLEEQKRQLVEANKVKSHYLNMAVHDLKNPMGAIKGFTELIEEEKDNPKHIQAYVNQILQVTQRMLEHIEQLLDTERKQIKKQKQQFSKVELASVIENVADQNELQAKRKGQVIETQLDESLHVSGNSLQLFQMVDNLLSNAIKYSPLNTAIFITLKADDPTNEILFSISDEGPGIEQKYHASIFEPWLKTNNKPTGGETSSGLGLNIVKEIVEMHEGTIKLLPQTKGTTFEIRFPVA